MAGPVVGARCFVVYPQPPSEPLPVAAGATGEIALSEQLAGPTVGGKPYAQMMFVRVAAHGGAASRRSCWSSVRVIRSRCPTRHLRYIAIAAVWTMWGMAGSTGASPMGCTGFTSASRRCRRPRAVAAADPQQRPAGRVSLHRGGGRNTPEGTLQPWIDVSGGLDFDLLVGQTATKSVGVANFGTVGFSVTGVGQLGPQLTVVTALPVTSGGRRRRWR